MNDPMGRTKLWRQSGQEQAVASGERIVEINQRARSAAAESFALLQIICWELSNGLTAARD